MLTAGEDVLYAQWSANNNTKYTVEHYTVDSEGNAKLYGDPVVKTGTTDAEAKAEPISIPGYTFDEDHEGTVLSGTITGDGKLVLKLYYTANADSLAYDANTGSGEMRPTEGYVDEPVTVSDNGFEKAGYTFTGWNTQADGQGKAYAEGGEYVLTAGEDVLYAQWSADFSEFELAVETAGQAWIYDGSERQLNITGVFPGDSVKFEFLDEDGNAIEGKTIDSEVNAEGVIVNAPVFKNVVDTATVRVTVYRGGDSASGEASMTINPAPLTVVTDSASKIFDGTPLTAEGITVEGFVNGEVADYAATGSITDPGQAVNKYVINWDSEKTTAQQSNYAIDSEDLGALRVYKQSIDDGDPILPDPEDPDYPDPDDPTIPDDPDDPNYPDYYGGVKVEGPEDVYYNGLSQEQAPVVTDRDGNPIDPSYYDVTYSEDTVNAGTVTITVSGKNGFTGSTQVTYDILKVDLAIATPSAGKVFDGAPLNGGQPTASGWQDDDAAQVTLTATGSITNVGSAYNTYTVSDPDGVLNNYNVIDNLGVLTVWPQSINPTDPGDDPDPEDPTAPDPSDPDPDFPDYDPADPDPEGPDPDQPFYTGATVDDPESVPYDGNEHQWTPTVTDGEGNTLTPGEDYTVSYSTDDFTNVGTITVTITGTGNYGGSVERTYQITPAQITVNIENRTKVEGSADPTFTFNYSGVVEGETMAWTGEFVREVGEAVGDYAVTQGGFVLADNPAGGFDAGNYTLVVNPGTLTITAATTPVVPDTPDTPTPTPDTPDTPTPLPTPGTPTPVPTPAPGDGGATPTDDLTATTGDDAEEAIGDEATPLTAPEPIDDDATPLAANEHRDCWVHWLMLLGILVTVVYYGGVGVRRVRFSSSLQSFEDDVLGNDETNR